VALDHDEAPGLRDLLAKKIVRREALYSIYYGEPRVLVDRWSTIRAILRN